MNTLCFFSSLTTHDVYLLVNHIICLPLMICLPQNYIAHLQKSWKKKTWVGCPKGVYTRENTNLISVFSWDSNIIDQQDLRQVCQIWCIDKWSWSKWLDKCRLCQPLFWQIWSLVSVFLKCLHKLILKSLTTRPLHLLMVLTDMC